VRKSIVIFGIIMAFILGSLVSASSVSAASGTPFVFMQAEIDAINLLIKDMQDELKNIHVPWVNVTGIPTGFADNIDNDTLSQISFCATNQIVKWNGTHWICADIGASIAPNIVVLHYEQNSLVTVPKTTVRPDLLKLAVWKIEKNSTFAHDVTRVIFDSSVYANVKQPSPSSPFCAIQIGWYKSEDGMDWRKSISIITATNDIFDQKPLFVTQNFLESESNFIAFGTRNSGTCDSDGVVKEFSGTLTIHLSPGQSLNQTLP